MTMVNDKCPWCREQTGPDGSKAFVYHNGVAVIPCRYCNGTGSNAEWRKHPEYARLQADERLKQYAPALHSEAAEGEK